jgi:hypothetical protein
MGSQMVDAVAGKAQAIGAHRVTLVAAAGFTSNALDRIRIQFPQLIDAVHLRPGANDEWPSNIDFRTMLLGPAGSKEGAVPVVHSRYIDALTNKAKLDILYGHLLPEHGETILLCLLIDSDSPAGEHGMLDTLYFYRGPNFKQGDQVKVTVNYVGPDGKPQSLTQSRPLLRAPDFEQ